MHENRFDPHVVGPAPAAAAAAGPELTCPPDLADLVVVSVRHGHSTPLSELLSRGGRRPAAAV